MIRSGYVSWPKWPWLIVHVIDCNFFPSFLQNQFLSIYKKMIRAWQFIIFTIHFSANSLRLTKRLICNQFSNERNDHLIINFDKSKVCNFSCQLFFGKWPVASKNHGTWSAVSIINEARCCTRRQLGLLTSRPLYPQLRFRPRSCGRLKLIHATEALEKTSSSPRGKVFFH